MTPTPDSNPGSPESPEPVSEISSEELEALRRRIDQLDDRIVDALSERAQIVADVGRSKRGSGTPIYAPHRERQVLDRVRDRNPGPLPDRSLEAIYRELMSGSFAIELPLRVAYLGPAGSFSHLAATRHFGSSVEHDPVSAIEDVFAAVAAGHVTYGVVPYENSTGGGITDTLDAFLGANVMVYAESMIAVQHHVLANCEPGEITRVFSKPQIFQQCRRWLQGNVPEAELVPMLSSSKAVQHVADLEGAAAIGTLLAGEIYGVNPIFEGIQDKADNITRFLVIAREAARPSGDDKTSICFVTTHKPGALVDVLTVLRDRGINMSHIDKRPSGRENWEYTFFIDCDAHQDDPTMAEAINEAREHCVSLKVLGSYPRAQGVL